MASLNYTQGILGDKASYDEHKDVGATPQALHTPNFADAYAAYDISPPQTNEIKGGDYPEESKSGVASPANKGSF
jgi:hypothetical protein